MLFDVILIHFVVSLFSKLKHILDLANNAPMPQLQLECIRLCNERKLMQFTPLGSPMKFIVWISRGFFIYFVIVFSKNWCLYNKSIYDSFKIFPRFMRLTPLFLVFSIFTISRENLYVRCYVSPFFTRATEFSSNIDGRNFYLIFFKAYSYSSGNVNLTDLTVLNTLHSRFRILNSFSETIPIFFNRLKSVFSCPIPFWTFSLTNLLRLLKIRGLKYIYISFEFKHTEFFTSHGGYLLNTRL